MAAQGAARRSPRLFGAVCARFMLPEQGMTHYDVLSRASALSLDLQSIARKANASLQPEEQLPDDDVRLMSLVGYHPIVTSLHVVRPFLFPKYYPEEWLQFIRPENIRVTLEFRDNDTGELVEEFPLLPQVVAHPTRDLALMVADLDAITGRQQEHIDMAAGLERLEFLEAVEKFSFVEAQECKRGDRLLFGGHLLNTEPHEDDCLPQPSIITGEVVSVLPQPTDIVLASTEFVLQPGMCGGPCINKDGLCVGMIEGVVQNSGAEPNANTDIRDGLAAILPGTVVEELVLDVMRGGGGERHHPLHDELFESSE